VGQIAKVVLDTNLIASAFGWGGVPDQVLSLAVISRRICNCISPPLIGELQRVLTYDKFDFTAEEQTFAMKLILDQSIVVYPEIAVSTLPNNDPDNRVLECALEARADCIVTGDKLLQSLHPWSGISILSPAKFLESSFID